MYVFLLTTLRTLNELLTAGIAIFAFSLLINALSFNLRDRVTRSFAIILLCVVVVFVAEALGSVAPTIGQLEVWLRLQWLGIIFLPPAYLHFSDTLLATTGRPSRGRRRLAVRIAYIVALGFLVSLPFQWLVGPLVQNLQPAPHLQQTPLTWVFTFYYAFVITFSFINLYRAYNRTVARTSRRRITYLMVGSLAPALGSYPYLLFGSGLASQAPLVFWMSVALGNMAVSALLVLMAYAVAFFGVSWPDRVVKRRLIKWILRGPVTASTVLGLTTIVRRSGALFGFSSAALSPIIMAGSILLLEHLITLFSPALERWLIRGPDSEDSTFLQTIEERLLTQGDLRQFLEAVLAAVGDRLQTSKAFIASLGPRGVELFITIGGDDTLAEEDLSENLLQLAAQNGMDEEFFSWGDYWLVPLFEPEGENRDLLGVLGVERSDEEPIDLEQSEALSILAERAALALRDRKRQQAVFSSLEALTPQVDLIQRLRAAARYDGTEVLTTASTLEDRSLTQWVKDALSHYWGGPKLTENPLLQLNIVRTAMQEHEDNPVNALRAVLRQAIEQVRPEGERRFTAEWILYNILEMKFMEGRKVREIALRLAMSEADLYRKQRVAIEAVSNAIAEMEQEARQEKPPDDKPGTENQHQSA